MIPDIFSIFADLRFRVDEENLAARSKQLRVRLKQFPGMLLSQIAVEAGFVWLLWGSNPHHHLLLWLGIVYALHLLEFVGWFKYRGNTSTVGQCNQWSRAFFFFALTVGLLLGGGAFIFMPEDLLIQAVLICVVLGLAAGSASTNATHLPSLYAYALGLMLPVIARVLLEQDGAHYALGTLMVLFLAVVLASGHLLHKLILLSFKQRFENQMMAQQLAAKNNELEQKVEQRSAELLQKSAEVAHFRDMTIVAMGILAEARDNETGNHLKRTQHYIRTLANHLRDHPRFKSTLTDDYIDAIYKLAPLHDIGKVGIPDHILLKPGKLTDEEFAVMKTHPLLGGDVLATAENDLPAPSRFLHIGRDIATCHHEKWDGSGYPAGLKGDAIPLSARLMAIADVYDALISHRVYKKAFSHEEAASIIIRGHGAHFDPDLVDAFIVIQETFRQIAGHYSDAEGMPQ
jgi:response regulator RpfG family c-di-GMP phosphodiesterase